MLSDDQEHELEKAMLDAKVLYSKRCEQMGWPYCEQTFEQAFRTGYTLASDNQE